MKNRKLYIIGNGFDLYHKMKTQYSDFHKYVSDNNSEVEIFLKNYYCMNCNDKYLWTNFESDLGTFDYKSFFNDINKLDPMSENFRPSFCYGLEDDITQQSEELSNKIKEEFSNWITFTQEEAILNPLKVKLLNLDKQSIYLSFNYTDTLTRLYGIEETNIIHIHNDVKNYGKEIIFGHNVELEIVPEIDENGDTNRTIFTDSENAAKHLLATFRKPINEIIDKYNDFFNNQIKNVAEIFILGHSINNIDLPYYKKIHNIVDKSTVWNVSYYDDKDKDGFIQSLMSIGIEKINPPFKLNVIDNL